ncbi:hypothetical protein DPX16_5500 [Anabarilius grahami]|uniref:Uncharacterized protein n=1 Tax=Anabarilius grahami TaxID=495550 RepID=A0A3N0Z356_ANAGA|nr:hypothetical protein DPX16_5500 [Anabarilius grahami]
MNRVLVQSQCFSVRLMSLLRTSLPFHGLENHHRASVLSFTATLVSQTHQALPSHRHSARHHQSFNHAHLQPISTLINSSTKDALSGHCPVSFAHGLTCLLTSRTPPKILTCLQHVPSSPRLAFSPFTLYVWISLVWIISTFLVSVKLGSAWDAYNF